MRITERLLIIATAALIALLAGAWLARALPPTPAGSIRVRVSDALTDEGLLGAAVVIAETGERYITDSKGYTPIIELRVLRDRRFDSVLRRDWGEATVLVYADGYAPMALLHVAVKADKLRSRVPVYMFKDSGQGALSMIESPNMEWISSLIAQFAP